ncbi:MAG: hypothetical protein Q4E60_10910 [Bacteroidales bacterium]|nr:hypothetical protein [Bacteroidales bacterium]
MIDVKTVYEVLKTDEEHSKVQKLVDELSKVLEGEEFLPSYVAFNIRLNELKNNPKASKEYIKKSYDVLSAFSLASKNKVEYKGQNIDKKALEKRKNEIIKISNKIAKKLAGQSLDNIAYVLNFYIIYLIDMEELSKDDLRVMDAITNNLEKNAKSFESFIKEKGN